MALLKVIDAGRVPLTVKNVKSLARMATHIKENLAALHVMMDLGPIDL